MSTRILLGLILSIIILTPYVSSLIMDILAKYRVHGIIDVGSGSNIIGEYDIELNITEPKGSREIHVGSIEIPEDGDIMFRVIDRVINGDVSLTINGVAELYNTARKYEIQMPCMISVNKSCYRTACLIPGYDIPLEVEKGIYNLTFKFVWEAEGKGSFSFTIALYFSRQPSVYIEKIGDIPGDTSGWVYAEGSTRSYALLVNTTKPEGYSIEAWAWIFIGSNDIELEPMNFTFQIKTLDETIVYEKTFEVTPLNNTYYTIHVRVMTDLNKYKLVWISGDIKLEIQITRENNNLNRTFS
ncbi:MAG: hypothetical protein B6U89_04210 [Desulfurococcales archaeon ex4484_58]|nr:MAG: hypothetical protein B6U89_04210 [Desulfurococcales archaeon ex4484_58]